MKPPTVLQVLPRMETGGVERGALDIAEGLVSHGFRALLASEGGMLTSRVDRVGAKHITLPLGRKMPWALRGNARAIMDLAIQEGVDLIHARSRGPAWSALWAARMLGLPFVTTFHGTYDRRFPLKQRYNAVMTRGDKVIAISHFIASHIRAHYHPPEDRIVVIPRGIDTEIFTTQDQTLSTRVIALARQWSLPDDRPIVMLPGRLTSWKGQEILLQAFSLIEQREALCLLVGSDQGRHRYRRRLEKIIKQKGLSQHVRIMGHCSDMPAAYMLADVVVSASTKPEAFGRVIAEAQAMGRPVIASDHGAAREVIPDNPQDPTGLLVPPGDIRTLAHSVDHMLKLDPSTRSRRAESAHLHVKTHFSLAKMVRTTLKLYRDLLPSSLGSNHFS